MKDEKLLQIAVWMAALSLMLALTGVLAPVRGADAAEAVRADDKAVLDDKADEEDEEEEDAVVEKVFPADSGPEKIDVSGYPKEMREIYKRFRTKCSKCHTIARPINSEYALPEEWEPYVQKMRRKRRSGVGKKDAELITKFLIYDSSMRKKDLIEKKLKAAKEADTAKNE